jgi:hypothetical protein
MLEDLIQELTTEVKGLKQAIIQLRSEGLTSTGGAAADPDDDLDADPAPAAKKAAAKKAAAKTAPEKGAVKPDVLRENLREMVRNERDRLKADVSAEAAVEHKTQTAVILKRFKAESLTTVADKDLQAVFDAIKAIDAGSSPEPEGDDDDL